MKVIEVKEHTPPPGQEFTAAGYPGDGFYAVPNGLAVVHADGVCMYSHFGKFVKDASAGCDPHRLLDQIIRVAGK